LDIHQKSGESEFTGSIPVRATIDFQGLSKQFSYKEPEPLGKPFWLEGFDRPLRLRR
jgi:hypothetical protein